MIVINRYFTAFGCAAFLSILTGCAQLPAVYDSRPYDEAKEDVVWPEPPEIARYRYVGQLTGEENFPRPGEDTLNAGAKLVRWMVGLVGRSDKPVILQRPQAVITDGQGKVFVSDVSRQAVYMFDTIQAELKVWENAAEGIRFELPIGLAVGVDGELLVADASLQLVARLGPNGEPLGLFGLDQLQHPTGLARDPQRGRIYVADRGANNIKVYSDAGELQFEFGEFGEQVGQLNGPTYLFWNEDQLYVTDALNSRIQVFHLMGNICPILGDVDSTWVICPAPKGWR